MLVPDHEEARALTGAAGDVALCVMGDDGVPAGRLEEVEFCVPPWWLPGELAELLPRMPRLRVVQTLSSGVEWVLPLVPPGVTVCNAARFGPPST